MSRQSGLAARFVARVLPRPFASFAIAVLWLLLNGTTPGQGILAVLLALTLTHLLPAPALGRHTVHAPVVMLKLTLVVLYDIVKANIDVALRILGPESRIRPGYVWVPLDLRTPPGITLFAGIITMTPGTLSCEVSEDRRWLLVHCFHLEDPAAVVTEVKQRYEAPLMAIFR